MRSGRRTWREALTTRLLCGAAALAAIWSTGARAQTAFDLPMRAAGVAAPVFSQERRALPRPPAPPAPADDALGDGFYLEADTLERDTASNSWTATGQVEARYQGRTLRANQVIYDAAKGVVTADGDARLINSDGTVQSADHFVLDDKMLAGFARGFSAREGDDITLAADVAIRRSETVNELDRAIFTPCKICTADGAPKEPTWSIQASKVIEDRDRKVVFYRNAVIRVKGIPIFFTPVFWHPDPTADRASGFLIPTITAGSERGVSVEQPYLWVVSPSKELIIAPQVSTKVNPVLNLEWLQRFYSGSLDLRAGYTYERDFDGNGNKFGNATSRSYVLGHGAFDLTKNWSWGFSVEWASDPLLFQKYSVPDVSPDRGLFHDDSQRLSSQVYATRQSDDSYLSISAMSFEGLRQLGFNITENRRAFPLVAPLIEWRYDPNISILGGRIRLVGSGVVINRDLAPVDLSPSEPPVLGSNSRRASLQVNWLRTFTLTNGIRIEPFADARGDIYGVDHVSATDTSNHTVFRGFGTVGVNLSWPFIRQMGASSIVLEPVVQLALSPNVQLNPYIPNEDSQIFQFDEADLFSIDKFSGYDLYDGGARLNIGGRATIDWGGGHNLHLLVGRTLRADDTNVFPNATGLNRPFSDWLVAADTTPVDGLSLFGRALFNDSFDPLRQEVGVNFAYTRARGYLRYVYDNTISTPPFSGVPGVPANATPEHDIEGAGEFFVTDHWGFSLVGIRDLQANQWRMRDIGLVYRDDCIRVEVFYQHEDVIQGQLGKNDTVFLRLTLATLGDQGYTDAGVR